MAPPKQSLFYSMSNENISNLLFVKEKEPNLSSNHFGRYLQSYSNRKDGLDKELG
jgi:hypothetical protein